MFVVYAVGPAGELPVLATSGGSGARNRYVLGEEYDDPSEVNCHRLQTAVARAFEVPGVYEVVVRPARTRGARGGPGG